MFGAVVRLPGIWDRLRILGRAVSASSAETALMFRTLGTLILPGRPVTWVASSATDMRTRLDTDLETIQRESQLRRIGYDLHDQASTVSSSIVDALAAVMMRLSSCSDYGRHIERGVEEAMSAEATSRHLIKMSDR